MTWHGLVSLTVFVPGRAPAATHTRSWSCHAAPTAGSEGFGLRVNVRRVCSQLVMVEMSPRLGPGSAGAGLVDSLNVSVATGVLLHSLLTSAAASASGAAAAAAAPAPQPAATTATE